MKPFLAKCFVSDSGPTTIRRGLLRGRSLPREIAAANLSMVFGTYERRIVEVIAENARGCDVAYDVGSHVGYMSLLLAECVAENGRVIAFEPSSREAALVEKLASCNGLEGKLTVERVAVCDENGQVSFQPNDSSFTGILDKAPESRREGRVTTVPAVTLDSFVYERGKPAPDFIKIDAESAEAMVVAGAAELLRRKRPKMVIEVHGPDACRDTIAGVLAHGYRIHRVTDGTPVAVTSPDQLRPLFGKNKWTLHIVALPG
jgi:FkbM family methyltransferase